MKGRDHAKHPTHAARAGDRPTSQAPFAEVDELHVDMRCPAKISQQTQLRPPRAWPRPAPKPSTELRSSRRGGARCHDSRRLRDALKITSRVAQGIVIQRRHLLHGVGADIQPELRASDQIPTDLLVRDRADIRATCSRTILSRVAQGSCEAVNVLLRCVRSDIEPERSFSREYPDHIVVVDGSAALDRSNAWM